MYKAFTMLELVFVIVVIGIISAMIAPAFNGNNTREAADQLLSHIRYTQHLAMMDEKFDSKNKNWFKNRWNIDLSTTGYYISHEQYKNNNSNLGTKYALNPLNPNKYLNPTDTKDLNISKKYGVTITNNCSTNKIYFDYLGRPFDNNTSMINPYSNLLKNKCTIILSNGSHDLSIQISPETGYARIN